MAGARRHLSAGALEALLDREGRPWRRARARAHLAACRQCAARYESALLAAGRAAALLGAGLLPRNAGRRQNDEAWRSLLARRGRGTAGGARRLLSSRVLAPALAVVAVAGLVVAAVVRPPTDLVTQVYRLSAQGRHAPKTPSGRDVALARSLLELESRGQLRRVSDICCADRDGEGPADDGVLTILLSGSRSPVVILYEDTQHRGRFQAGDVILLISRPGRSAAAGASPRIPGFARFRAWARAA